MASRRGAEGLFRRLRILQGHSTLGSSKVSIFNRSFHDEFGVSGTFLGSNNALCSGVFRSIRRGQLGLSSFNKGEKSIKLLEPRIQFLHRKLSSGELKSFGEKVRQAVIEKPKAALAGAKQSNAAAASKQFVAGLSKPVDGVKKTLSTYGDAIRLQLEAFWKRNYLLLVGAVGLGTCLLLWRIMFGVASMFVTLSEGMAKFGFLALAAAMVAFTGLFLKARFTINPDAVYRIVMRKLNTSADVLKALGAPLSGTDVRAYVMTGGGIRLKRLRPRLSSKRCFLIFPVQGSERKGLVSVETKKKSGQYEFKLLAVDIPTAGVDQRLYLMGDEAEYEVGGGLISELREPIVKAMAAQSEFDAQDEKDEENELKLAETKLKESLTPR